MHRTIRAVTAAAAVVAVAITGAVGLGGAQDATAASGTTGACPSARTLLSDMQGLGTRDETITVRHRGDFTDAVPENSLAAFERSYELCRPAIETDVRVTSDGVPVLFHDLNVGKMLEPSYSPEARTGPNARLGELTFAQLRAKRLVTIDREATPFRVPTVEEMLRSYVELDAESIIHLEIKESAATDSTLKAVAAVAADHPGLDLLDRVLFKISMKDYPTPTAWNRAVTAAGLSEAAAYPVMAPWFTGIDQTASVQAWADAPRRLVPIVEVVLKDSSDFLSTSRVTSRQGSFDAPTSLATNSTRAGSMARMAAIVKASGKGLGAFVPIPDYVLWRSDPLATREVPDSQRPGVRIPAETAYFNNTGDCCYHQNSKVKSLGATTERNELRMNLAWQARVGLNVATADDADAVARYFDDAGRLSSGSYPNGYDPAPDPEMRSPLAWDLGYVAAPRGVSLPIAQLVDYRVTAQTLVVDDGGDGDSSYEVYGDASLYSDDHLGTSTHTPILSLPASRAQTLAIYKGTTSIPTRLDAPRTATVRAASVNPRVCLTTGDSRIMELDNVSDDVIIDVGIEDCVRVPTIAPGAEREVSFELRHVDVRFVRLSVTIERPSES